MFDFVEEALDQVSVSVEVRAEDRYIFAVRNGFDVGPCAAFVEASPQLIAVVGAVGQRSLALDESVEHIAAAASVIGLTFGLDERVDLRCQAAPRATHAATSLVFFWALAAC